MSMIVSAVILRGRRVTQIWHSRYALQAKVLATTIQGIAVAAKVSGSIVCPNKARQPNREDAADPIATGMAAHRDNSFLVAKKSAAPTAAPAAAVRPAKAPAMNP